jgi:hypothetical protein
MISAPTTGTINVDYTIQFRFSDPGTTDSPWWYQTLWGNGKSTGATATTTQGQLIIQTFRYGAAGTYTVTVRVQDKDGALATRSFQVTIARASISPGG